MGGKIGTGMDGTSEAQGCGTVAAVAAMWQPAMGGKTYTECVAEALMRSQWRFAPLSCSRSGDSGRSGDPGRSCGCT